MKSEREPTVITALKEKASIVRQIACDLNFAYVEEEVAGESDLILFRFELDNDEVCDLTRALPVEVYAYRAFVTGPLR